MYELILIPHSVWTGNIRENVSSEERLKLGFLLGTKSTYHFQEVSRSCQTK